MNRDDRNKQNDFVRNVLSRTSGSACDKACEQLPDLAGGMLPNLDRQLVQAHLEHCDGCRAVAVVLGWVQPLLPELAELDPGPAFTQGVLARTTGAEHPLTQAARRGETVGPLGLLERLSQWWHEQIFRPRFALEVAYVATVVLLLLTSIPGAPLRGTVQQAGDILQAGPTEFPLVGPVLQAGQENLDTTFAAGREGIGHKVDGVRGDWTARVQRSATARQATEEHLDRAWRLTKEGELNQIGYQLLEAARQSRESWHQWWTDPPKPEQLNRTSPDQ